jgi:hypothetical protein
VSQGTFYLFSKPMGGRTKTTLASNWNNQATRTIRVPVVFADEVMQYARDLDAGTSVDIEALLNEFIQLKRRQLPRHRRTFFTMDTPVWNAFNEFRRWLEIRKWV